MINKILKEIEKNKKIALFHHINPDADTISSTYGLLLALKQKYPKKKIVWIANIDYLNRHFSWLSFNKEYIKETIDNSYLGIVGDTSTKSRIENLEEFLKTKVKIIIDHHRTKCDVKVDILWQDATYPASALQIFEIVDKLKINLNNVTSFFLLIGILSDTGNFTYSLSNWKAPAAYSKLLKNVKDEQMDLMFKAIKEKTSDDINLVKYIYKNIVYGKKSVYVKFAKKIVRKYGKQQISYKINLIGNIKGFSIWAFLIPIIKKESNFDYNVSIRSNGPNIENIASYFGGGGHKRAAGTKIKSSQVKEMLAKLDERI